MIPRKYPVHQENGLLLKNVVRVHKNSTMFKGKQNEGWIPELGCMWNVDGEVVQLGKGPGVKANSYRVLVHDSLSLNPNVSSFQDWTLINNT